MVLQGEAATRVEATVGERTRVFVTDKGGVWELSAVGATRWDEKNWEPGTLWLAALLRGIDPRAGGVRSANGVLAAMDEKKMGKATLPGLETQRDGKGVTALTVSGVRVTRGEVGPLPALAADAFVVTGKKEKGLATLARLTDGLTGGQKGSAGSTAAARGVTDEEKKLGGTYDFASVERIEATSVSDPDVDDFIRAGKLGGGR